MSVRKLLLATILAASSAAGVAQHAPAPMVNPLDLLRAEFAGQSGATTVYFEPGRFALSAQGRGVLTAQAGWLRRHPAVAVRIEGHGDVGDTRDHALALGASRAAEVRNYLLLLGVPGAQVGVMSWGKERPGAGRAVTTIVG